MKLKKIITISIVILLLFTGCSNTTNTPSKKVEDFLSKYQNQDKDLLTQLDLALDTDTEMDDNQKKDYKALMTKQYQNLSYKITDEQKEGDSATVDVEVEVYDYATSITKSKEYFDNHKDEFIKEDDDKENEVKAYIDYKLKKMKDVTEKTTYPITFHLTKENDEWVLDDITDSDRQKIHGLY